MATVKTTATFDATPDKVWAVVSDLPRWGEWLVIHRSWQGDVPASVSAGAVATANANVMNMPIAIEWTVDNLSPLHRLAMSGKTRAGILLSLRLDLVPVDDRTRLDIEIVINGGMIDSPMGGIFRKTLTGALDKSSRRLGALL
ncbi:SRPBCC family protein [Antrihabitans stalactiti]|uniref:SRPBCC family protein n=1 Tax=Antrihabitans stalactiti TaxID=2584121 RepID=A0A848K9T8_9NOCA|nr:SRPBCC family protein [Antrihabitans stalactiti]NMN95675.1 SRPBCC family protein [Antrihabitans stalactiti]